MPEYKQYRRKQIAELADWTPDINMDGVSISEADTKNGSPKLGDKIARNPKNHSDRWLVAGDYFRDNFEQINYQPDKPKIICLCGSTRFIETFAVLSWEFEKEGAICLGLHYLPSSYTTAKDHLAEAEGVKEHFDNLHKRKIDLADEIFVININGYIGESTRSEIDYATKLGKVIRYLEPQENKPCPECGGSGEGEKGSWGFPTECKTCNGTGRSK